MRGSRIRGERLRLRVEALPPSTPAEEAALREALRLWRASRAGEGAAPGPEEAAGRAGGRAAGRPGR
ncbi:MAG: hypothetical protein QJR14_00480 [Bacillota bacterium]|nr:hypothetical protein [Bacillota bacterium]